MPSARIEAGSFGTHLSLSPRGMRYNGSASCGGSFGGGLQGERRELRQGPLGMLGEQRVGGGGDVPQPFA